MDLSDMRRVEREIALRESQDRRFPMGGYVLRQTDTREVRPTLPRPLGMFISKDIVIGQRAIVGSGVPINAATCGVFALLEARGIPTAFKENGYTNWFVAELCGPPEGNDARIARQLGSRADRVLAEARRQSGAEFAGFAFETGVTPAGKVVIADIHRLVDEHDSPDDAVAFWESTAQIVSGFTS